jgi:hypothetical protein
MLGSFGDSDFWIVPSKPDEGMMMRLLNAAETKHRNLGMGSSKKLSVRAPLPVTFHLIFLAISTLPRPLHHFSLNTSKDPCYSPVSYVRDL